MEPAERHSGTAAWIRTTLESPVSPAAWCMLLALLSGLLTFVATTGGLFIVLPWAQSAVVAGIAVGLLAPRVRASGVIGGLVGLGGAALGPVNINAFHVAAQSLSFGVTAFIGSIVVCAGVAALVCLGRQRWGKAGFGFLAVAFLLLIGNLWFTTLTMSKVPGTFDYAGVSLPSFDSMLRGDIPPVAADTDRAMMFYVYKGVKHGANFYPEYARVLSSSPTRGMPASIADVRLPTLFWFWSLLPDATYIVIAFLVLATAAVLAVIPISAITVKLPLVLPGAAALASYFLFFPRSITLFSQEGWAGALGVLALALYAASLRPNKWRMWTVAAVSCAILAVLTREIMAFLPLAGLISAFLGDRSQRRFRVTAWAVGILTFAVLFGAHWLAAQPYIAGGDAIPRAGQGSVGFMIVAFEYATDSLGIHGWLPPVLGALGIAGAYMVRDPRLRTFALLATLMTLASFLFIGNGAIVQVANGEWEPLNYWGAAAIPLLYACIPSAFSLIPSAKASSR